MIRRSISASRAQTARCCRIRKLSDLPENRSGRSDKTRWELLLPGVLHDRVVVLDLVGHILDGALVLLDRDLLLHQRQELEPGLVLEVLVPGLVSRGREGVGAGVRDRLLSRGERRTEVKTVTGAKHD